jgi:hypothetical protein
VLAGEQVTALFTFRDDLETLADSDVRLDRPSAS